MTFCDDLARLHNRSNENLKIFIFFIHHEVKEFYKFYKLNKNIFSKIFIYLFIIYKKYYKIMIICFLYLIQYREVNANGKGKSQTKGQSQG